jgi:hypothetical protein
MDLRPFRGPDLAAVTGDARADRDAKTATSSSSRLTPLLNVTNVVGAVGQRAVGLQLVGQLLNKAFEASLLQFVLHHTTSQTSV